MQRITNALIRLADALLRQPEAKRWLTELSKATGHPTGTLSPILNHLIEEGWLTAEWEYPSAVKRLRPARRYLTLTSEGRDGLAAILELNRAKALLEADARGVIERPTLYLAGPLPQWNHTAFHAAAIELRAAGFTVFNPAEFPLDDLDWAGCLRRALHEVLNADAIAVLPGWEDSRGARLELHVARALGMTIRGVEEWIG